MCSICNPRGRLAIYPTASGAFEVWHWSRHEDCGERVATLPTRQEADACAWRYASATGCDLPLQAGGARA